VGRFYRFILVIVRWNYDYRGRKRFRIGENPYPGRSISRQFLINFQELFRFVKDTKPKNSLTNTRALKGTKKGKRALILGNGPSLGKLNLSAVKFDQPDIWVVNDFYKTSIAAQLDINYYCFSDPVHINALRNVHIVDSNYFLKDKLRDGEITLVLPHWSANNKFASQEIKRVIFFDDRQLASWSRNIDPTKPRGYLSITLYKAIRLNFFHRPSF
jgi:hypothetical protein